MSSPPDECPIRRQKNTFQSQEDVNTKPTKLPEMQENAGNQVVIEQSKAENI